MAIYEYRCEDCDHTFVVAETISEHDRHRKPPKCPQCGERRTVQLFTGFFAKTDSKS